MDNLARRLTLSALIVLMAASLLAGCGKKGRLEPPPGEELEYPRTYPSR